MFFPYKLLKLQSGQYTSRELRCKKTLGGIWTCYPGGYISNTKKCKPENSWVQKIDPFPFGSLLKVTSEGCQKLNLGGGGGCMYVFQTAKNAWMNFSRDPYQLAFATVFSVYTYMVV